MERSIKGGARWSGRILLFAGALCMAGCESASNTNVPSGHYIQQPPQAMPADLKEGKSNSPPDAAWTPRAAAELPPNATATGFGPAAATGAPEAAPAASGELEEALKEHAEALASLKVAVRALEASEKRLEALAKKQADVAPTVAPPGTPNQLPAPPPAALPTAPGPRPHPPETVSPPYTREEEEEEEYNQPPNGPGTSIRLYGAPVPAAEPGKSSPAPADVRNPTLFERLAERFKSPPAPADDPRAVISSPVAQVKPADLEDFKLKTDGLVVNNFNLVEDDASTEVCPLLKLSACYRNPSPDRRLFTVMAVGQDESKALLWACAFEEAADAGGIGASRAVAIPVPAGTLKRTATVCLSVNVVKTEPQPKPTISACASR